jgi:valyl-tRNA synthetase
MLAAPFSRREPDDCPPNPNRETEMSQSENTGGGPARPRAGACDRSSKLLKHFEADEISARWDRFWQDEGVYHYDESRGRSETFVVDTPPPTASGSLHIGHVFSYTQADVVVRYKRMTGMNIFYPMGWDDNGLPTERRVQNYYHIRCDPNTPYEAGLRFEQASAERARSPRASSRGPTSSEPA